MNSVTTNVPTKVSFENPKKVDQHVNKVIVTSFTYQRSNIRTPFELLIGVRMREIEDLKIKENVD